MYHEFLQKAAIDSLAFGFQEGWNIDSVRFKTSMPMSAPHPLPGKDVLKLTTAQLEESLRDNRIAKLHVIEPELCLPPKTKLLITPSRRHHEGLIQMSDPYVTLSIRTKFLGDGVGIGEQYRLLFNMPPNQDFKELETYNYEMSITADFNRVRSGHPNMPLYEKWVSQIVAQLREDFDEEQILADTKETYLFTKQAAQFRMTLDRVVRFSPPQRP